MLISGAMLTYRIAEAHGRRRAIFMPVDEYENENMVGLRVVDALLYELKLVV